MDEEEGIGVVVDWEVWDRAMKNRIVSAIAADSRARLRVSAIVVFVCMIRFDCKQRDDNLESSSIVVLLFSQSNPLLCSASDLITVLSSCLTQPFVRVWEIR